MRLRVDRAAGSGRGSHRERLRMARRPDRRAAGDDEGGGLMYRLGVAAVWLYRISWGALFPTTCKYHPSCSQYAVDAVRAKGLVRGSVLAGWRLLRCNPWSRGG